MPPKSHVMSRAKLCQTEPGRGRACTRPLPEVLQVGQCAWRSSLRVLGWIMFGTALVLAQGSVGAQDAGAETPPAEEGTFDGYQRSSLDTRHSILPFRIDAHAAMTWEADVGAGLRLDIPFMHRAQHQHARDELAISVGADL